ncbi:hypothetical protein ACFL1X_13435, partial [Candidatus Hydrogenedentota bacterium]
MSKTNFGLRTLVFKACLVAAWADNKMSSEEHRYVSYLIEMLCENEKEREVFRKLALHEINREVLLAEIKPLNKTDKRYLFEECLGILKSDKKIGAPDLRFLSPLRKTCGIGFFHYLKKLAFLFGRKRVLIHYVGPLVVFILIALLVSVLVCGSMSHKEV